MSQSIAVSFSVFKRKNKKNSNRKISPYYYAQFKLADGSWTSPVTTHAKTKDDAKRWCIDKIKSGQIIIKQGVKFGEFAKDFFSWNSDEEKSQWVRVKLGRKKRLSQRWCTELSRLVETKLIPVLGAVKLSDIDEIVLDQIVTDYSEKGYAGSYINKMLIALKAILTAAHRQKLIPYIPYIEKMGLEAKEPEILTFDEALRLFSITWKSYRGYVGNLLAVTTGIRLGELQAITLDDVHLDESYILIRRSWDNKFNRINDTTKTGKERKVFLHEDMKEKIKLLMEINPHLNHEGEIYLFFNIRQAIRPAREKTFTESFYKALKKIGINEKERMRRNITFHTHRHFYNTRCLEENVPLNKVQATMGHSTLKMTEKYNHTATDMREIIDMFQREIFSKLPGTDEPGDPPGVTH